VDGAAQCLAAAMAAAVGIVNRVAERQSVKKNAKARGVNGRSSGAKRPQALESRQRKLQRGMKI
jgi:hypothetical protein